MAALLGLVVLTVSAVIATASWAAEATSGTITERNHAFAITGWAALSGVAGVVALATGEPGAPIALALLLLGAVAAVIGVAGAGGLATAGAGLGRAGAEAALIAGSVVTVFWALAGAPASPGGAALVWITLATIDVLTAALLVQAPAGGAARGCRPIAATALAALCGLALADGLMTLDALGRGSPADLALVVRAAAYLVAAVVPWVPRGSSQPARRPSPILRSLPYLLVGAAVVVLVVSAFAGRVGPVSVVLVALVVLGLAAVQELGLRENARLLGDLELSRSQLVALVENVTDVILGIDGLGRVHSANAAASRLLHRAPEEMAGLDVGELARPDGRTALRQAVDDVVRGRSPGARVEVRLAPPATGTAEVRMRSVPGGAVANLSDVTDAVRLREQLERLARFDNLTGLANRAHLLAEIEARLRARQPVAVLYCDLDGFKAVNDRFGHLQGDVVLVEAASRLRAAAEALPGTPPLVARIGGDEFVVALVDASEDQLPVATERLLEAMRPTFQVGDRAVRVGLSIGVATSGDVPPDPQRPGDGADGLLHRADVAMFAAKQAGRFRSMRWDAEVEARAVRRVDIAIGLRRALDSSRLALAYQPLVRLSDGVVVALEALLRVEPEDDGPGALSGLPGLVTPAELVAVAEDTGEMTEVGHWVITEAAGQAARWRALGHDVVVTVNVSVRQMAAEGFVAFVRDALAGAGLAPAGLVVEITEGQLLSEADPAWAAVEQLRDMGVMLVIDDFGSGYSSLAYLRRMPVRGVKLDRAILDGLTVDPRARTLARAVIGAARALGLLVVAEGLESLEAARVVRDLGAWAGQGFALFEALRPDEVAGVLAAAPVPLGSGGGRRAHPASVDVTDRAVHEPAPADLT